ncbi:LytR C-terminal domain-containing protein [Bifidobacterium simiiventris]|uniref:LytR C-terminal domain-containing protein n=1 Tax=Bifidobacterium simiiventris TaxID=2834434 RepID=UPI001C58C8D9|nr:LytR C-terminal domain-containing protein [Bifidobacterium simiiventris]MBW3078146.1 LytR C-terminal domain-containing protein [Bifidobacterium simiiventris]
MAKQDKATYDSYAPDMFDNPPVGPVGVHRGPRSLGARVAPYLTVLVVAILAGALTWSVVTGEFSKMFGLSGGSDATTSQTSGSSSDQTSSSDSGTGSDAGSSDASSNADANADGSGSTDGDGTTDSQSNDQNTDSQNTDSQNGDQSDQSAQVNKAASVRVVNASGINGYAGQKKTSLEAAGYTSVEAANPTSSDLPTANVVWYQNDTDKATAEDVAATLGISDVQQTTGLDVSVVVVLLN